MDEAGSKPRTANDLFFQEVPFAGFAPSRLPGQVWASWPGDGRWFRAKAIGGTGGVTKRCGMGLDKPRSKWRCCTGDGDLADGKLHSGIFRHNTLGFTLLIATLDQDFNTHYIQFFKISVGSFLGWALQQHA